MDVDIPAPLLLPLVVVGLLPEIRLSADDVELNGITADVDVTAQDVPMYTGADWSSANATVVLDQAQTRALLSKVDGFPAESVTLDPPDVALDTAFPILGTSVPVGVTLSPAARDGQIVLSPTTFRLAAQMCRPTRSASSSVRSSARCWRSCRSACLSTCRRR
ncbi:LmeA family phospholipid-binding protein [Microbacterium sp. No. 7]